MKKIFISINHLLLKIIIGSLFLSSLLACQNQNDLPNTYPIEDYREGLLTSEKQKVVQGYYKSKDAVHKDDLLPIYQKSESEKNI